MLVGYLGFDFANPTLGKETALAQYEQGADIVFQVAGRSGEGVLSAAAPRGGGASTGSSSKLNATNGSGCVFIGKSRKKGPPRCG